MAGGFNNPIIGGGGALVYPSIHSPDYVAGSTGWTVNKDGSAEFNSLTIRGTFNGHDFVINADGVFFYSPSEGAGNLIISNAPAAGVDDFGNSYGAGLNVGHQSGAHAGIDLNGQIFLFNAADQQIYELSAMTGGLIAKDTSGNIQAVFSGGSAPFGLIGPAVAFHPGTTNPETWQPITPLDAGWTAPALSRAAPRYMLLPDGNLQLDGCASAAAWAGGKTLNSASPLPAAYQPKFPHDYYTSDAVGTRAHISISTAGVITATLPGLIPSTATTNAAPSGTWFAEITGVVPLT